MISSGTSQVRSKEGWRVGGWDPGEHRGVYGVVNTPVSLGNDKPTVEQAPDKSDREIGGEDHDGGFTPVSRGEVVGGCRDERREGDR